jgi:chromate transporter
MTGSGDSGGNPLAVLAAHFALLSLVAIGGANVVVPDIHRFVVEGQGWMSGPEFAQLFAIAQAAPGPNVIVVTLIGWQVAGFAGALVATAAMTGPTCLLTYGVSRVWDRFRDKPWRKAVQAGLVPITVGLVLATGYILTRAADHDAAAYALTAATAIILVATRLNPLWLLAAGAVLGLLGVV